VASEFETSLSAFQAWANQQNPEMGAQVARIIQTNYISQLGGTCDAGLGDAVAPPVSSTSAATNTIEKLGNFINSLGQTYITSAAAYYNAKGQLATMKAQAQAESLKAAGITAATQGVMTVGDNSKLFLFGGAALLAVLLLKR
jgi:hypothetical protein